MVKWKWFFPQNKSIFSGKIDKITCLGIFFVLIFILVVRTSTIPDSKKLVLFLLMS